MELAGFAKALAHPARVAVLRYLGKHGETACMEIVRALPLSQPACSRHINELVRAGLLCSRAEGNKIYLRIEAGALSQFCGQMSKVLNP